MSHVGPAHAAATAESEWYCLLSGTLSLAHSSIAYKNATLCGTAYTQTPGDYDSHGVEALHALKGNPTTGGVIIKVWHSGAEGPLKHPIQPHCGSAISYYIGYRIFEMCINVEPYPCPNKSADADALRDHDDQQQLQRRFLKPLLHH